MSRMGQSLLRYNPLLWILIGAQVMGHDHLGWLWGGACWLVISRLYFIPKRMHRFNAPTVPRLLGDIHGRTIQGMLAAIYIIYFLLLFVKIEQKVRLEDKLFYWVAIVVLVLLYTTKFSQKIVGLLLFVCCACLPILVHCGYLGLNINDGLEEGIPGLGVLYKSYFSRINPSIFLVSVFLGHPLLSHELLEKKDKRISMRNFKWGSFILLCFALVNSCILEQMNSDQISLPAEWGKIISIYRIANYLLVSSFLLYMISIHVICDVVTIFSGEEENSKGSYIVVLVVSVFAISMAYFLPSRLITWLLELVTPGIMVSQLVFLATIIGLVLHKQSIYTAIIVGFVSYGSLVAVGGDLIQPYALGITIFGVIFLFILAHYIRNNGFIFLKRSWWEKQEIQDLALSGSDIKKRVLDLLILPIKMAHYARESVSRNRTPYKSAVIYLCLSNLLGVYLWPIETTSMYWPTFYFLFLIAFILCVGLLLQPLWPRFLAPYFALYWHLVLSFYLGCMPIVCYLMQPHHPVGMINMVLSIVLLARLVNFSSFCAIQLIVLVGSFGIARYFMPDLVNNLIQSPGELYTFLYSYGLSSLVGGIFVCRSDEESKETRKKLQSLIKKSIAMVSNALNIPKSHASMVELCLDSMEVTEGSEDGKDGNGKVVINMEQESYERMKEHVGKTTGSMDKGRSQLKRKWIPINGISKRAKAAEYVASSCVKGAVEAFVEDYDAKERPIVEIEKDFTFKGSDENLKNAIVELLANAYEHSGERGKISIHLKDHKIYVNNHHSSIQNRDLPHIFNEFFTTKKSNLGLGLFFVKQVMASLGGKIYLQNTKEENITSFVLVLPQL